MLIYIYINIKYIYIYQPYLHVINAYGPTAYIYIYILVFFVQEQVSSVFAAAEQTADVDEDMIKAQGKVW